MHFSQNNFWPKTTENMKNGQKQKKIDFFVHKIKTMNDMVC